MSEYWEGLRKRRLGRRRFLSGTAVGTAGLATLALVGCGDDDDDDDGTPETPAATGTTPAGTEEPSGGETTTPAETPAAGQPTRGGTVTWRQGAGAITHVDPHRDAPVPGLAVAVTTYSGVIRNEIQGGTTLVQNPDLAEAWEQPDDLSVVFTLRGNATWWDVEPTNGRAVTAEDIALNFQRMVNPEPDFSTRQLFDLMESAEAVDETTVRVTLRQPDAYFLINAGRALPRILAPGIHDGDTAKQTLLGSGPFIPHSTTPNFNDTITWTANPNYYIEGVPYIDTLVQNIIPDAAAAEAALRAGQIDWIEQFSYNPDVIQGFQDAIDGLQVFDYAYFPHKASMNCTREPFTDKRVRQAVAHAMDQQGFLDLANFGKGRPSWAMPPWLEEWAVPESEFPAYDPAESIKLLEAAGYPDGIEITDSVFAGYDFYSVVTQEQLAQANIRSNLEVSEFGEWYGNVYSGSNYIFSTTGDFQFENPDRNLRTYYHSAGTLNNTRLYETDPDATAVFDKLVDDARSSLDVSEQQELLKEAQRWIIENVPAAYGGYIYTVILVQGRLQDYNIQPAYLTGGLQPMQFPYMWVNDA